MVSMEGFGVTPDGRHLSGMFPWPAAGVADVANKTWKKLGEGCYTSLTYARGPLFWYFDGAHRNVTMVDVDTGKTMDGEHHQRARIRERGGVPPALDEPSALSDDDRALQPGRTQPVAHRRQTDRGVCRPFQRGLLEGRGAGRG